MNDLACGTLDRMPATDERREIAARRGIKALRLSPLGERSLSSFVYRAGCVHGFHQPEGSWPSVEQERVWEQERLIDRYTKPTEQTASG